MQSIRYGVSLHATIAITTSAFMNAGQENPRNVMNSLNFMTFELCKKGGIDCIFFDGREDRTKFMLKADNSDRQFPSIIKEEHYYVCSESGGKYLYHITHEKGPGIKKPAEV